jgi:putative flippase GtrA
MAAGDPGRTGRPLAGQLKRFLVVGLASTAGSYLAFLAFLQVLHHQLAYALAFAVGLLIGYGLNATWTFGAGHSMLRLGLYPLAYLPQLALGAGLLEAIVTGLGIDPALAVLVVIAVSVPFNFILMRWIFRYTGRARGRGDHG